MRHLRRSLSKSYSWLWLASAFVALIMLLTLSAPVQAQGEPPIDSRPSLEEILAIVDSAHAKELLMKNRPLPTTPEEWIEYKALLELKQEIESGTGAKYRNARMEKERVLPELYSPQYLEAQKVIGQGVTKLLRSGKYSLDQIANMSLSDMETALGRDLPDITALVDTDMAARSAVHSASNANANGLEKRKARRGDIILVHNKQIWKPAWYGYWTHTIVTRGYDSYMHAPGPGKPVQRATWRDDIAHRTTAIMGVWSWSSLRDRAASYSEAQWNDPYSWWSPKWSTRSWYCSKLPWAGYFWKSWGIIDIDANSRWWGWWWWYWVTPDDIWFSGWTYIRDFSWSA